MCLTLQRLRTFETGCGMGTPMPVLLLRWDTHTCCIPPGSGGGWAYIIRVLGGDLSLPRARQPSTSPGLTLQGPAVTKRRTRKTSGFAKDYLACLGQISFQGSKHSVNEIRELSLKPLPMAPTQLPLPGGVTPKGRNS